MNWEEGAKTPQIFNNFFFFLRGGKECFEYLFGANPSETSPISFYVQTHIVIATAAVMSVSIARALSLKFRLLVLNVYVVAAPRGRRRRPECGRHVRHEMVGRGLGRAVRQHVGL